MCAACGVVGPSPGGVRERVVGVVDELEFVGAGGAVGGGGGEAVRVGFQGGALVGGADFVGGGGGRYLEEGVCRVG